MQFHVTVLFDVEAPDSVAAQRMAQAIINDETIRIDIQDAVASFAEGEPESANTFDITDARVTYVTARS